MTARRPTSLAALAALAVATACGSNDADVPDALLRALDQTKTAGYPDGPYGAEDGQTVQNLCFEGWKNPRRARFDPAAFQRICLSDFHDDPDARLVLVESCAIWCAACRAEYGGSGETRPSLEARFLEREARGFRVMGTLYEDAQSRPATPDDAVTWARTYDLTFPFALDPDHGFGLFTSPNVAPYNVLVDTKTMKIVFQLAGDQPSRLFSAVDDFLAQAPE